MLALFRISTMVHFILQTQRPVASLKLRGAVGPDDANATFAISYDRNFVCTFFVFVPVESYVFFIINNIIIIVVFFIVSYARVRVYAYIYAFYIYICKIRTIIININVNIIVMILQLHRGNVGNLRVPVLAVPGLHCVDVHLLQYALYWHK